MSDSVSLESIRAARERIRDIIYHSPCPYSLSLSRLCGCEVYCKLEHLQMTGSFKERGARNKLLTLSDDEKSRGVIAASAGNHALALAYHGQSLGIPVTVCMPKWAPLVKVANCRSFGAEIIFAGETYDDAKTAACDLADQKRLTYIPGFDDSHIIAGAGTIGLEILEDVPDLDIIFIPVGGGGLIAGIGTVIKALKPDVQIIAVESNAAPTLDASLKNNRVTKIQTKPTLADGLAVAEFGKLCFDLARRVTDKLLLVDEAQTARAILRLLELEKMVVEGAGAVSLAAAMDPSVDLAGRKVVLLLSGGNIDVTVISKIIERGMAADGRLVRIVTHMSDRPGSLARLTSILAGTGASVHEVQHDRQFGPADVGMVNISCVLETRDEQHIAEIGKALTDAGISYARR